mgnify:CR=1 FL=1
MSLLTAFPDLTSLVGLNQIEQTDEPGISAGVSGLYEAGAAMLHDGAIVGVRQSGQGRARGRSEARRGTALSHIRSVPCSQTCMLALERMASM